MVFEAVVVELLNKFLKQYVENLDTSQLKIGIWGGDVVLNDLKIRTTLLDDLDLPVRVKWGKLGKLAMKIPWKNIYTNHVVIHIEDLLVIVIPNTEVVYNAKKEEKWALEKKQAKLKAIEEAKKQEIQDNAAKSSDSFLEKLITQIVKNIQIVIRNIHIRYEDKTTIPGSPFSVGVTMANLIAETTVKDPTALFSKLMHDNKNFICKVLTLDGLAVYWNSRSALFSELGEHELSKSLIQTIPTVKYKPDNFIYMFGPMSASLFLRLNPKPEGDNSNFTIPKIFVKIYLKEIDLAVTHNQFSDLVSFLQDFQRISAAAKYRKYRPIGISVTGHVKEWWHFAYQAVAEDIIRRKREWSWKNIKEHRDLCKKYSELFKSKLMMKKLSADQVKEIEDLEKKLNVFNLVLLREQVYVEVERINEECLKKKYSGSGSWFSGWFGSWTEAKSDTQEDELVKKIESVVTAQEKDKLYKAIGYEEGALPAKYPITFVEFLFWFELEEIKAIIYDDRAKEIVPVMKVSVQSVRIEIEQRPSAFATKVVMILGRFQVTGKQEKNFSYPDLVTSNCKKTESLVELLYETKPLNVDCDQLIHVNARPLKILYHAETINFVRDVFTTEAQDKMEKFVAATSASLPTFQKITSLGLEYAIEKRTVLQLKVNIMSSCIIIPYGGVYHWDKDMLVIILGELNVETEENSQKNVNVKKLFLEGTTNEEIFSTVVSASYTNFKIQLTGVQIIFQISGEDWVTASNTQRPSPMRFLESTNLEVIIKKSLVLDDARIPKMIIEGNLPSLTFNFSEDRFINFVALACSIQTKVERTPEFSKKGTSASSWSLQSLGNQLETRIIQLQKEPSVVYPTEYVQGTDLIVHFEMNELMAKVSKTASSTERKKSGITEEQFLFLRLVSMELELTCKTFETIHLVKLGGIDLKQFHKKVLMPVVTTRGLEEEKYLFVSEYVHLDRRVPDFYTNRNAIMDRLMLSMGPVILLLHQEAILAQLSFIKSVQTRVESVTESSIYGRMADTGKLKEIYEEGVEVASDKKVLSKGKRFRTKRPQKEVIDFLFEASLEEIDIKVEFEGQGLAKFSLKGASVAMSWRKSYTNVDLNIKEVTLLDLNPTTFYKKIVTSLEKQNLSSKVTVFNKEYLGTESSVDMSLDVEIGGVQVVFLAAFSTRAFEFLSAFQSQVHSIKEGATVAAQKAKENMIKVYQNATQICLNLKVNAPVLVVPRSTVGYETLNFDLGKLTVQNVITELDYSPEGDITGRPLTDVMKLHLYDLKIYRCVLNESNTEVTEEVHFLVPVTFELIVKRNLSRNWFRVIPELEVLGRLNTIHVTLTHEDLWIITSIFKENFMEGEFGKKASKKVSENRAESKVITHKKAQSFFAHHMGDKVKEGSPEDTNFYTVVKFMFSLDSFVFDALTEESAKEGESKKTQGLARFVLESMSLKGRLFSDGSINTAIMLVSCLLDDTRPGKKGRLTRFLERTIDYSGADLEATTVNGMFEIIYQQKEDDVFIDVRVYKFTLILSMDFLQKLGGFFTLNFTTEEGIEAVENIKSTASKIERHLGKKDLEIQRPPTFTINLRVEKPDIVIVENLDSVNADALIFHTEMVMKYRVAGSRKVIGGTLSDIQLHSCCFNPVKRPHTMIQVIKPFTVSVAGSTPEGLGLHIDICLTELMITVNPSAVELIAKCCEALLQESSRNENAGDEKSYLDLWNVKSFDPDEYWFLKPEEGVDALTSLSSQSSITRIDGSKADEICLLAIPSLKIFIEGSSAARAQPLLMLDLGFQMQCFNWSQKMSASSTLTIEMLYFNKTFSAWEPMIEPVEYYSEQEKTYAHKPWELNCSVVCSEEGEIEGISPPRLLVTLSCVDIMQITLTKTSLDVLKTGLDTYTTAVTKHYVKPQPDLPPYLVKNETGLLAELLLEDSNLQLYTDVQGIYKIVGLESNSEVELQNIEGLKSDIMNRKLSLSAVKKDTVLLIKFPIAGNSVIELPLGLASKRYYPISTEFDQDGVWSLVVEVSIVESTTTIVLQSTVRIWNYFNEPISIHSLSEDGKVAEYIGTAEGNSSFSLPFHVVYSQSKQIFFGVSGYSLSAEPFVWENLKKELNMSVLLECASKNPENQDPFFIQAVGETEQIYYGNTKRKTVVSLIYKIHLQPTVKLLNALPVPLVIHCQGVAGESILQPGNVMQITNAEPGTSTVTLRIDDYLEKEWSCKELIPENPSEFLIWKFVAYDGLAAETLNLGVHVTFKRTIATYAIYCPYFMVNKTNLLLAYKFENSPTVFYHPRHFPAPIMFSPTSKKFFNKKFANLQVEQSLWSDKFPVDVAGSGGTVECKSASDIVYKVSVTITLMSNSLTKIVVFTPFYVFLNSMNYAIEYQESENGQNPWHEIPSQSCVPFWPTALDANACVVVRPKGSTVTTPPFNYSSTDNCLLRLSHKLGGIFVVVKATQAGTYVTFSSYEPGLAPALIINHSAKPINLHELKTSFSVTLNPLEQVMHSWVNPTGERSINIVNPKHIKSAIPLDQDSEGLVFTSKGEKVRYVTFLDGAQRVLLFTDDNSISKSISTAKITYAGIEIICKIQGIGLSLVNNISLTEILYMAFMSSEITWEGRRHGKTRFKRMKDQDIAALESAYENYLNETEKELDVDPVVDISDNRKVDFEKMELILPHHKKELKRKFEPGVWMAYRQIENQVMVHVKINKIQIDSQIHESIFPVVLSPVPPPKSVATVFKGTKPFFELSVVKIAADKAGVAQYKYFKVLVQEFHVKLDITFIQKMYRFLAEEEISEEEQKSYFKKDLEFIQKSLISHVEIVSSNEQKQFFDLLHFPPLKIHFSFSLAGKIETESLPPSLSVMLQSLGVTLTDVHDVIFRLSYFERKAAFLTQSELIREVKSHYYGQTIRQAYVLLLGLDVIGNPYGLIVGIGEGVEAFFYEPFQGMIKGPSEFGVGMAIGCKSLFGHTVGSAAGTLGKLTETLGKGLAVLSLDKEYQMQRMEERNRQENIQASMARGGRGLVMGVYEGVTGVVRKPLKGAKEEGVGGFFKGMGKGMMGLVTRPVTGVVDFASTSFNAVRRATEVSAGSRRLRPPRFFRDDCIVLPYRLKEAQGNSFLYAICKRKYCSTDKYEYHLSLRDKEIVILTNRRIILGECNEIFGIWQEHMAITWRSMPDRPRCHTKGVGITMPMKADSKKRKPDVKVLLVEDPKDREELCRKMIELYNLERQCIEFMKSSKEFLS